MSIRKFFVLWIGISCVALSFTLLYELLYAIWGFEIFKVSILNYYIILPFSFIYAVVHTWNMRRILSRTVTIKYKNWKKETNDYKIHPLKIWFGSTKFHLDNQWLLKAYKIDGDIIKKRNFAIKDILSVKGVDTIQPRKKYFLENFRKTKSTPSLYDQLTESDIRNKLWKFLDTPAPLKETYQVAFRISHYIDENIDIYSNYSISTGVLIGYLQVKNGMVLAELNR